MFWEDYYHKHPIEAKKVRGGKEVQFVTGDKILDKWEEELARGLEPDLTEGLSPEARAKELAIIERDKSRGSKVAQATEILGDGFVETYGS
jgi:hypothetical protein